MAAPRGNKYAKGNSGLPPKPIPSYWEEWQEPIINLYLKGASDCEVRSFIFQECTKKGETISVSWYFWDKWKKENKEFFELIKIGVGLSQGWWEKQARINLQDSIEKGSGTKFNAVLWFMNMKNRFREDWRDSHEIDHKGSINTTAQVVKIGDTEITVASTPQKDNG